MGSSDLLLVAICAVMGFGIVFHMMGTKNANDKDAHDSNNSSSHFEQRSAKSANMKKEAEWQRPTPEQWDRVLAVKPGDSPSAIKAEYLKLIQQYHPDRFLSAAPEISQYAMEKTKSINEAYQHAQKIGRA